MQSAMQNLILVLFIGFFHLPKTTPCVVVYSQCGGLQYSGETDCCDGSTCQFSNTWYSQCLPNPAPPNTGCSAVWGQCGGQTWSGATCCDSSTCIVSNPYYSQCLPSSSSSAASSSSSTQATSSASTSASTSSTASSSSTSASTSSSPTAANNQGCSILYAQCGGSGWSGPITCCSGSTCQYSNPYYSQCLSPSSSSATSSSSSTQSTSSSSTSASTSSTVASSSSSSSTSTSASTSASTSSTVASSSSSTSTSASTSSTASSSSTSASTSSSSTTANNQGCSILYAQCGGSGWSGPITCCSGSTCQYSNPYYSQCLPFGQSSTTAGTTSSSSNSGSSTGSPTTTSGNSNSQSGTTTRYWDCCKPSCAWPGKASVTNPVETCAQDGVTIVDPNTSSGCNNGGSAYTCSNQQPWNVSSTLSYGYAAANINGEGESDWCCACYSLIFTSGPVIGKQLIVQVTNTGGDLNGNQFDLAIPGGGFGLFNGCASEFVFGGPYSWGQQYGGVSQRSDCTGLPLALQPGCYWRFDWFQGADNPTMSFTEVPCPSALTAKTQCIRN